MESSPLCLLPLPPAPHFPCRAPWHPGSPHTFPASQEEQLPLGFPGSRCSWGSFVQLPQCDSCPFSRVSPDCSPHTFGVPLSQVIANDRACRQLQEAVGRSRRLCLEVEATVTKFRAQRQKRLGMGTSCIRAPGGSLPEEPLSPNLLDKSSWSQRRVRSPK